MPRRLDARAKNFESDFVALIENKRDAEEDVSQSVKSIIADVRAHGDAALIALSRRYDRVELSAETLRVSPEDIAAAERGCPQDVKDALHLAAARIETYHRRQLPKDVLRQGSRRLERTVLHPCLDAWRSVGGRRVPAHRACVHTEALRQLR